MTNVQRFNHETRGVAENLWVGATITGSLFLKLAAQRAMAILTDLPCRAVTDKTIVRVSVNVRDVTIGAARGVGVELMPQWQKIMVMVLQAADSFQL